MTASYAITRRAFAYFLSTGLATLAFDAAGGPALALPVKPSFAVTTPIHIHSVSLRVRNLDLMTSFYSELIGMDVQKKDAMSSVLGKDGVPLVQLIAKPADQPDNQVSAGLYHTAFLMPSRKELGRWLIMAVKNGVPFTGFADHLVSEALYLNDPEGNGVEVYADRPPSAWKWKDNQVVMGAEDLKVDDLVKGLPMDGRFPYAAPAGFRIGHVHLRVGDLGKAQDFYIKAAGLDLTDLPPNLGAAFFSNGRYHHHIGSNVWQSAGAGQRPGSMSGLDYVAFSVQPRLMEGLSQRLKSHGSEFQETANGSEALDPWGTKVRFISA